MGDRRFDLAWTELDEAAVRGESNAGFLRNASDETLVHLLAADAGKGRSLERNVIATALLNRLFAAERRGNASKETVAIHQAAWDQAINALRQCVATKDRVRESRQMADAARAAATPARPELVASEGS